MSSEETLVPKRRSSAANRRRRKQGAGTVASPVEETIQESTVAPAETETVAKVERHLQRQQDRRSAKAQKPERKGVQRVVDTQRFTGVRKFYEDTMSEIRKVIWPDRMQTRNLTLLVIALSVILGTLLGGLDFVLLKLFEAIA